jgi:tRNA(Ile)-lysidine synthase TilS/MesJ
VIIQSNFCLDRINEQTKKSISLHWQFSAQEEKLARFRELRDIMEKKIKDWLVEQNIPVK